MKMLTTTLAGVLICCLLLSCDSKSPVDDNPRLPDDSTTPAKDLAKLPPELASILGQTKPVRGEAGPDLAWKIPPDCSLEYQVSSEFSVEMETEDHDLRTDQIARSMTVRQDFSMSRGGPADFEITWGTIQLAHKRGDTKRPPGTQEGSKLARTWLNADGGSLDEVEGPTVAWSAFGTFPGPVIFFPSLPSKEQKKVSWSPRAYAQGSGLAAEKERGKLEGKDIEPPEPKPIPATGDVTLAKWVSFGDEKAALLEASWTTEVDSSAADNSAFQYDMSVKNQSSGHYLVSESGWLLAAHVAGKATTRMVRKQSSKPMIHHTISDSTIRLVDACSEGDVVFPGVDDEKTREEVALELLADHRNHLAQGEWKEASRDFSRKIREKYGDRLPALLKAHYGRFGFPAMGTPELASSTTDTGEVVRVEMVGSAKHYDAPEEDSNMSIRVVAHVSFAGEAPKIALMGSDPIEKDRAWNTLEISEKHLRSRAMPETYDSASAADHVTF